MVQQFAVEDDHRLSTSAIDRGLPDDRLLAVAGVHDGKPPMAEPRVSVTPFARIVRPAVHHRIAKPASMSEIERRRTSTARENADYATHE